MPIYEYECQKCKARTEVMQKMTAKPLVKCDKCGGRLEKQWSSTSFQLKGTGWYVTDYASKSETKADTKESKTGTKEATTSKSEEKSKPAGTESKTSEAQSSSTKKTSSKSVPTNSSSD